MTKCKLLLLVVLLLMCGSTTLFSQQAFQSTSFTAAGNNGGIKLLSSGVGYNGAVWNKSGVVTLCSFKMDSSVDGSTWNNGDILGATDCSVNGSSAYTAGVYNYVRVRVTSFTGSGSVRINQLGYIINPTPTSGFDCSATADTEILFNDGGACGGDAGLTWNAGLRVSFDGADAVSPTGLYSNVAVGGSTAGREAIAVKVDAGNDGTANATTTTGIRFSGGYNNSGAGGTVTSNYGADFTSYAGVATSLNAAIHIADQGTGANDYAIKVDGGQSVFGGIVKLNDDTTIATGKALKTDTTIAHTALFQAYDVDGTAYKTFATLTNANIPSLALAAPSGGALTVSSDTYSTSANCANSGGTCGAAAAGAVTIAAAATTVTVATTAVTAASRIAIAENSSLGGALGVTCNTTFARVYAVTTVTAGTSFVITSSAAPATNPACLTYSIVN